MPKPTFFNLSATKRELITETAIEEFASHTYEQASISRIVQRAGISKGSMYQYFENKLDLFTFLIFDEAARRKMAYFRRPEALFHFAQDPDFDLFALIRESCEAGFRFTRDHPRLARVGLSLTQSNPSPEIAPLHQRFHQQGQAFVRSMLATAVERGQVDPNLDLNVLAMLFTHITGPMLFDQIAAALDVPVQAFLDEPKIARRLSSTDITRIIDTTITLLQRGITPEASP